MSRAIFARGGWIRRLKEAALWHVRLEGDATAKDSTEFRSWLSDVHNCAAWNRVADLLHLLDYHREAPEVLELRTAAWRRAHSASSRPTPLWLYATGGVAAVIFVAIGTIQYWPTEKPVVYTTGLGQSRAVALPDGSRVTLDSSSSVTVLQFSHKTRALELTKGRAHFDVVHDAERPFSVSVGSERVVDVGTAFNVEKLNAKVFVTLTQGRVEVESDPTESQNDSKTFMLAPGQELVVTHAGHSRIRQVDLQEANAWEHGQIVFNAEPLGEAAERLNRYLAVPLKIDPAIAKTRISGVFSVRKLDAFVGAVTSYFPIQSREEHGHILLERRA